VRNKKMLMSIFCSMEKMDLLLLLQDSLQEKGDILKKMEISPQKLSPQLIEFIKLKIIRHQDGKYELTSMGHLLVAEITLMIEEIKFFHEDYWWDHNFDFIHQPMLKRLIQIKGWTRIQPEIITMYDPNKEIYEKTLLSDSVNLLSAVHLPLFFKWASDILDNGKNLSVIFDLDMFNKIKKDKHEELQKLIINKRFRLYTYPELRDLFFFLQCDRCIELKPLINDGTVDNISLLNSSTEAVQWGRELFEYYLKGSTLIAEI